MSISKTDVINILNNFYGNTIYSDYNKLTYNDVKLSLLLVTANSSMSGGGTVSGTVKIIDSNNDELSITSNGKLDINSITTLPALATGTNVIGAITQSGTWNLANITGTISLPTGASTSAKQPALGIAGTASTDVLTVQGIASMTPFKVDGSATTQPVSLASLPSLATGSNVIGSISNSAFASTQSGTWNVTNISGTISLPTGASTSALQTTGNTSLSSIDSKTPGFGTAGSPSAAVISIQGVNNGISLTTNTSLSKYGTIFTTAFSSSTTSAAFSLYEKFMIAVVPPITGAPTITLQISLDSGTTWVDTSVQVVSSASVPTIIESDSFAKVVALVGLTNVLRFKSSASISSTITLRYAHA